jgi:hypothetical protein
MFSLKLLLLKSMYTQVAISEWTISCVKNASHHQLPSVLRSISTTCYLVPSTLHLRAGNRLGSRGRLGCVVGSASGHVVNLHKQRGDAPAVQERDVIFRVVLLKFGSLKDQSMEKKDPKSSERPPSNRHFAFTPQGDAWSTSSLSDCRG